MKLELSKRAVFLLIYGFIVIALLIYILFIAPDEKFNKNKENVEVPELKFLSLDEQKENLLKNQYSYEFSVLYSINDKSYTYICKGNVDKEIENGTCTSPSDLEYDQDNKKTVLKNMDTRYLNVEYLFDFIKDQEPTFKAYEGTALYKYKVEIKGMETDILLYSNYIDIFDIQIDNINEHYHIKYSNIKY